MMSSIVILGKVGIVCGMGFVVATGFEWLSDLKISPKNKNITLGSDVKTRKEVDTNDAKVENLSKRAKQQG